MERYLSKKVDTMEFDGLISGLTPQTKVTGATIRKLAKAATIERGTILAKSSADNKCVVLGNTATDGEQKFNGDGTAKAFTVTAKPATLKSVKIGASAASGYTYDASTGVLNFAVAPTAGTNNVIVTYESEKLAPCYILADDVEVGTAADVNVAVYDMGCFNPNKLVVKTGYTITEADKDALRQRGIFLETASAAR